MSPNTFDDALDFLPAPAKRAAGTRPGFLAVLAALSDGFAAARCYEELVAKGVPHAVAQAKAIAVLDGKR